MPEQERIKQGTVRADGRVFYQRQQGREYWMTTEQFHRTVIVPREAKAAKTLAKRLERQRVKAERKAKWEADMAYWDATREDRRAAEKEKARIHAAERRASNPQKVRENERVWTAKKRLDPDWVRRRREITDRHKAKRNPHKLLRWGMRVLGAIHRERYRNVGMAMREGDRHKARLERETVAKSRKPRVILTPEQRAASKRAYKRNYKHRRRAIIRGQEAKATSSEIRELKKLAKGRCFYCRAKTKALTLDHITAIASGGGHMKDNIVFACHACNSEKRDLPPEEYAKKHGMLLV